MHKWYTVYLLHFTKPGGKDICGTYTTHYIGYTSRPLQERLHEHFETTRGASHIRRAIAMGFSGTVANTRAYATARAARRCELRWKRQGARRHCPVCSS